MSKTKKIFNRIILPVLLLIMVFGISGCTAIEAEDAEMAIKQEQKYQEQISDTKQNDRAVEQELEDILDESGEVPEQPVISTQPAETKVIAQQPSEEKTVEEEQPALQFRKKKYLDEHYEKHGIEMGFSSAEDYLKAANAVLSNPDVLHKKEKEDNDDIYYVEATNEFVVVSEDGYIRTYFNPSAGIDYYNRQ